MWIPSYIALGIAFTTIVLQIVFKNKITLEDDSRPFRLIDIVGIVIPMMIIVGNLAYVNTDTTKEALIVGTGLNLCLVMILIFGQAWSNKKYNFIAFIVVMSLSIFAINQITPYMLSTFDKGFYGSFIGALIGSSVNGNKYKYRLIITSIIVLVLVLTQPMNFMGGPKPVSKVERIAIEFAQSQGYEITDEDKINFFGRANRNQEVHLWIVRMIETEQLPPIYRGFDLTYYKGDITEFKKIK